MVEKEFNDEFAKEVLKQYNLVVNMLFQKINELDEMVKIMREEYKKKEREV